MQSRTRTRTCTRKSLIVAGARLAALGLLAAPALLTASGCGGSMAASSTNLSLNGITAYGGNPSVEIKPTTGGSTTGEFTVDNASSITRANEVIFVEALYYAEIRNVNPTASQSSGTFSVEWSEVLPTPDAAPRATFNSSTGTTFTGAASTGGSTGGTGGGTNSGSSGGSGTTANIRVTGVSGNFLTVSTPGPITLRMRVTLHASDGSSRRKDFFTTLTIVAPASA